MLIRLLLAISEGGQLPVILRHSGSTFPKQGQTQKGITQMQIHALL